MRPIEQPILARHVHRVFFTRDVFVPENPLLAEVLGGGGQTLARVLVTLDDGLAQAQPALTARIEAWFASRPAPFILAAPPLALPGGEAAKNSWVLVNEVLAAIAQLRLCRHSYVVAVGGGAHLDVVGFAAALAHRGLRHVRLPSTTLAQADSGVGVKNGINAFGRKNFVGTFAPPFAVINDFALLDALPVRDKRAGYAEAVKVALIRDAAFFDWIEARTRALAGFERAAVETLIHRSAELHVTHIATGGDPFESGSARPLDFGHWAAHKLEALSDYRLRHGEAVAIGLALDTVYSRRVSLLDPAACDRILRLLEQLGFRLFAEELHQRDASGSFVVLGGLDEFREHLGGELTVTLLAEVGRGLEVHAMDPEIVGHALEELAWRARPACGLPA
jgi:3-dehydroquinate synthase